MPSACSVADPKQHLAESHSPNFTHLEAFNPIGLQEAGKRPQPKPLQQASATAAGHHVGWISEVLTDGRKTGCLEIPFAFVRRLEKMEHRLEYPESLQITIEFQQSGRQAGPFPSDLRTLTNSLRQSQEEHFVIGINAARTANDSMMVVRVATRTQTWLKSEAASATRQCTLDMRSV